ncbi:SixA phosphatase family protein [Nitratireductor basaltis]|uniref:Phosphoglycerate mutase n=1 Tax=Nitratireductor basaltis TaxID=472175 RepID=A0A084UB07_9HYPH|nr:histidine phosphatase family protein [Nitratireductor basaltis]KFB10143.1 Phosphoglycerate mutase [Nitratireductor basaltis]
MNRLLLLRHASATFGSPGISDFDRCLSERGIAEAERLGAWLRQEGISPGKILCSSAARARQTLQGLGEPYARHIPVEFSDQLYRTDAQGCRLLIARSDDCETLMVVGHNPTLEDLLFESISSGQPDLIRHAEATGMPQCALAVLEFDGHYVPFANDTGHLAAFNTPDGQH